MEHFTRKVIRWSSIIGTACGLAGCDWGGPSVVSHERIDGDVRLSEGGAPVVGALVLARWIGHVGYSGSVCYHAASTRTDEFGRYRIEEWRKPSPFGNKPDQYPTIRVFAPNLVEAPTGGGPHVRMVRFNGSSAERLDYLVNGQHWTYCSATDEPTEKASLSALTAIFAEADSIAKTPDEKYRTYGMLRRLETAEVGEDEATRRYNKRLDELYPKPETKVLRPEITFQH